MPRASMASLISRLRVEIGDPPGAEAHFTDDQLEAILDRNSEQVRMLPLATPPRITPNGAGGAVVSYPEAFAPVGDWEDGVTLQGFAGETLTPASSDLIRGVWVFSPPLQVSAVYLSGATYDLHAAAAEALEAWASAEARSFDVSTQGAALARSQKARQMLDAAAAHRARSRPTIGALVRSDEQ